MVAYEPGVIEAAFNETENELSKHKLEPNGGEVIMRGNMYT